MSSEPARAPGSQDPAGSREPGREALTGLRVLDFCWVVAGPMATRYLALHGATVVRIESRHRPDAIRGANPYRDGVAHPERSGYYSWHNTDKYNASVNMRHPRAREVIHRLVRWADVVTENFTPGTMEEWGLGFKDLQAVKPDIVMVSASMLGRGGPHAAQPGFGIVLTSLAGLTHVTGWPERLPITPFGAYTDFIVSRFITAATLAAVDHRNRTGHGVYLDFSQLEAVLHFLGPTLLDYTANGRVLERRGNRHPAAAPHGVYPCRGEDRWCAIACSTDAEWVALCGVLGQPALAGDPRFATLLARKAHEEDLDATLARLTPAWSARELMEALQGAGVPAGVVATSRDLFEDPQLRHRGHFTVVDHPEIGPHAVDTPEFRLSRTPFRIRWSAPLLGAHTEHVCREFAGMSEAEYRELKADGALE